ncbi:MAG: response regulator receiver protein [Verrucomicrobiales bacterium]|jgi:CheY-like chemotaxis protein|nr:response regulator receiver protein [Verrucomicrobiales bacterium]
MNNKILVVDDSGLARRMTRQMLEQMGYVVEEAADGATALERYVLNNHDLVVLDMVMQGMYGLDVLQKFQELNPKLPVIIATADIQKSTRDQVKESGAAALINKPLKKEELAELVQVVLSGETAWT